MIYLKSLCVGIIAVVMATVLTVVVGFVYLNAKSKGDGSIGWDPISFARSSFGWVIMVVAFLIGFIWEFRR